MAPPTPVEKTQPWLAAWLARIAAGKDKKQTAGTSHGAKKGENVVIGGHTSGISIKMTPNMDQ